MGMWGIVDNLYRPFVIAGIGLICVAGVFVIYAFNCVVAGVYVVKKGCIVKIVGKMADVVKHGVGPFGCAAYCHSSPV